MGRKSKKKLGLVEHAGQLVDQVGQELESARDLVVEEYVPQARAAGLEVGRKARKAARKAQQRTVEEYVPQAREAGRKARKAAIDAQQRAAAEYVPLARETGRKAQQKAVEEYVPLAREAGRKAQQKAVEEYVPQARKAGRKARKRADALTAQLVADARTAAAAAATAAASATTSATAAVETPLRATTAKKPKRRGRKLLVLLGLAGVGAAVAKKLNQKNIGPAAAYEAPYVAPTPKTTAAPASTPSPDLKESAEAPESESEVATTENALVDGAETATISDPLGDPLVGGAQPTANDDGSFFEQVMAENKEPARRRTRRPPKEKPAE